VASFYGQVQAFRLVLRSGRKLLQSDSQELIVTTWLLPIATPSNPAPMQLPDNQTAAIADALISKQLALNPVLFGNYSVIQILPPGGLAQAPIVVFGWSCCLFLPWSTSVEALGGVAGARLWLCFWMLMVMKASANGIFVEACCVVELLVP
jgi:hypothetical protein